MGWSIIGLAALGLGPQCGWEIRYPPAGPDPRSKCPPPNFSCARPGGGPGRFNNRKPALALVFSALLACLPICRAIIHHLYLRPVSARRPSEASCTYCLAAHPFGQGDPATPYSALRSSLFIPLPAWTLSSRSHARDVPVLRRVTPAPAVNRRPPRFRTVAVFLDTGCEFVGRPPQPPGSCRILPRPPSCGPSRARARPHPAH